MANKTIKEQTLTRAEKTDAAKKIILQLLEKASYKSIELIEAASKAYAEKYENGDSSNDVKGRIGSVLDVMKKDGEVVFEGGRYEMKPAQTPTEKPKKRTAKAKTETKAEEKPVKAKQKTKAKTAETPAPDVVEEAQQQPATAEKPRIVKTVLTPPTAIELPLVEPLSPMETAQEPVQEEKPKKRGRKPKAKPVAVVEETPLPAPIAQEEKAQEETKTDVPTEQPKAQETPKEETKEEPKEEEKSAPLEEDNSPKGTLMDMSFLIGNVKPTAKEKQDEKKLAPQPAPQAVNPRTDAPKKAETEKIAEKAEKSVEAEKTEQVQKPTAQAPGKPQQKQQPKPQQQKSQQQKVQPPQQKPQQKQSEDKLQERFLERLHKLGGEYFEYYSVYLLERYSRQNGRRLEALRISGGEHDGGIDGEIELTDKLGFRETIYIQAKNWDAEKGNKKLWIVGETLLQQFLGACAYRQAKDGKQNCRGIFITTSKFTPEARRMLDVMSDKIVGYDGTDLFETAKECGYGVVKKNGEWTLDEDLLSGGNAFFRTF